MFAEGESGTEVLSHHLVGDVLQESGVHVLLELLSGVRGGGLGGVFLEESLGSGSSGGGLSLEGVVGDGGDVDSVHVDALGGVENVGMIDSLDWNTVELVWSSHGNEAGVELFQSNNSLSSKSSGEEDADLSWLNSGLGSSRPVSVGSSLVVVSWVPVVSLDHLAK